MTAEAYVLAVAACEDIVTWTAPSRPCPCLSLVDAEARQPPSQDSTRECTLGGAAERAAHHELQYERVVVSTRRLARSTSASSHGRLVFQCRVYRTQADGSPSRGVHRHGGASHRYAQIIKAYSELRPAYGVRFPAPLKYRLLPNAGSPAPSERSAENVHHDARPARTTPLAKVPLLANSAADANAAGYPEARRS